MRYLGMDVHAKATVWCLLDASGEVVDRGKVSSSAPALTALAKRLRQDDELLVAQEVGTMSYFVHDVLHEAGVPLKSFNAYHLRMIASSRKKTDRRDAYWIAKALQTGMTPHPVYIPCGQVRRLRQLLHQRDILKRDQKQWLVRAKSQVRAAGLTTPPSTTVSHLVEKLSAQPDGLDADLAETLARGERMHRALGVELRQLEATIRQEAKTVDAIARLQTIPGVGLWVGTTIYAWVGDVSRFPTARHLAAYAGMVPSVWQSGDSNRSGSITKQGSPALRRMLTQAGHILLAKCKSDSSAPLRTIAERIHSSGKRRKVAVVAAGRHILRIAYYVLRDGTVYEPSRLSTSRPEAAE